MLERFSVSVPEKILEEFDRVRGMVPRSPLIVKLMQRHIAEEGSGE